MQLHDDRQTGKYNIQALKTYWFAYLHLRNTLTHLLTHITETNIHTVSKFN